MQSSLPWRLPEWMMRVVVHVFVTAPWQGAAEMPKTTGADHPTVTAG